MLNKERVDEVFWLLRKMLNVDEKFSYKGIPVNDILPLLQKDLVRMIMEKGDESEAMLDWFADSVFYMRGDTDELPQIEVVWNLQ